MSERYFSQTYKAGRNIDQYVSAARVQRQVHVSRPAITGAQFHDRADLGSVDVALHDRLVFQERIGQVLGNQPFALINAGWISFERFIEPVQQLVRIVPFDVCPQQFR